MTAIGHGGNEAIEGGFPPGMDILLVEQEVAASDEITALQMVVQADTRRTELLDEAKDIEAQMEKGGDKFYAKPSELKKVGAAGAAENWSIGARVRYKGMAMTVIEDADEEGDVCMQEDWDTDGAIAERLRDGYEDPAARLAAGGVNDVQLFGSLLTRMQGEVRAGFFAVGCRSRSSTDQWVVESRPYKQTAHHYCAHEAPNVSPWNIFEYITHLKTGTGPIALSKRQKERFNAGLAVG